MLRSVCVHKSEALFLFKKKPPQAPPKEGMYSPKVLLSIEKKPHPQPNYSLSPNPSTASPPTPLRMERGVKTASRMGEDG